MTNVIIVSVLLVMFGTAIGYIVKEKKKGTTCIGCPHAGNCRGYSNKGMETSVDEKEDSFRCSCH